MFAWWDSSDVISDWSTRLNWAVAGFGLLALVFSQRESTLDARDTKDRDDKVAAANKAASEANERAGELTLRAAQLEKDAAQLQKEAAVARLELEQLRVQQSPRSIGEQSSFGEKLAAFAGTNAVILRSSASHESLDFGGQIRTAIGMFANWKVGLVDGRVVRSGVRVDISPMGPNADRERARQLKPTVRALIDLLHERGVDACEGVFLSPDETFEGIVIAVGPRPQPEEADEMRVNDKLSDPNTSEQERAEISEQQRLKINEIMRPIREQRVREKEERERKERENPPK